MTVRSMLYNASERPIIKILKCALKKSINTYLLITYMCPVLCLASFKENLKDALEIETQNKCWDAKGEGEVGRMN